MGQESAEEQKKLMGVFYEVEVPCPQWDDGEDENEDGSGHSVSLMGASVFGALTRRFDGIEDMMRDLKRTRIWLCLIALSDRRPPE